jgi:hypothetical protein
LIEISYRGLSGWSKGGQPTPPLSFLTPLQKGSLIKKEKYMESKITKGSFVLIRTYSAGVHFGFLEEKTLYAGGCEVRLSKAKRLWNWTGALSLSEVAMTGPKISGSKIAETVDEIILPQAIEIITISSKSTLNSLYESNKKRTAAEV